MTAMWSRESDAHGAMGRCQQSAISLAVSSCQTSYQVSAFSSSQPGLLRAARQRGDASPCHMSHKCVSGPTGPGPGDLLAAAGRVGGSPLTQGNLSVVVSGVTRMQMLPINTPPCPGYFQRQKGQTAEFRFFNWGKFKCFWTWCWQEENWYLNKSKHFTKRYTKIDN